jgi:putative transposase
MKIQRAYKTEIKPNNKQRMLLEKSAGVARFTFNWGLAEKIKLYQEEKKSLTAIDQHKILCSKKKREFPWMYEVTKCAPQEALRDLETAFKNFYKGLKKGKKVGFPKFKSKKTSKPKFSVSAGFYVTNNTIKIPKIGKVRLKEKGYIPIKDVKMNSMTVSKVTDRWYVSLQVEQEIPELPKDIDSVIGVDLGISTLATCSDGSTFENTKYLEKSKKRLSRAQRDFSRKSYNPETKKSSNNRNKAKLKLQKIHQKIRNQRKDTIHKMTTTLVKTKPRYIVIEDLNVSGMMKNRCLAGSIGDASFSEIKRQLTYKTSWYGGLVIEANRFYPSSKMCSKCGSIKDDLTLGDRTYVCSVCGNIMDRDFNASVNLENLGLSTLSPRGIKACGESVRLRDACGQGAVSAKQEENVKC